MYMTEEKKNWVWGREGWGSTRFLSSGVIVEGFEDTFEHKNILDFTQSNWYILRGGVNDLIEPLKGSLWLLHGEQTRGSQRWQTSKKAVVIIQVRDDFKSLSQFE